MPYNIAVNYYACLTADGYVDHYHRRSDNLMANPYSGETYPDQWCKKGHTMSIALWCDAGNHAFSSKDPDAQEFTRTVKKKDRDGRIMMDQEDFNVCGRHAQTFDSEETRAINGVTED